MKNTNARERNSQKQLTVGGALFLFGQLSPLLFVPLVTGSGFSPEWKTALSGLFLFGIPPLFTMAAIAVLGKAGFNALRERVFGSIRRYALPQTVSRTRYRLGLVLFVLPFLYGWLSPYLPLLVHGYEPTKFEAFVGDLLLIVSLFWLGGDFWDKLRALFIWEARVVNTDPDKLSRI